MPRPNPQQIVSFDGSDPTLPAGFDQPNPADTAGVAPDIVMIDNDPGLITRFERMLMVPDFCERWYRQFQEDRVYLNDLAMLQDEEDTVSTNYIFRNQQVLMSQLNASDPDLSCSPRNIIVPPPPPPMMVPGPMGQPIPVPAPPQPPPPGVMVAPIIPPGPLQEIQSLALFGTTCQLVVKHFLDAAGCKTISNGALQDASTVGIAWVKVIYQEDFQRDALGVIRTDDEQIKYAEYRYLQEMYQANIFDENCPEYKQMRDVSDTIKQYVTGKITDDLAQNPAAPQMPTMDPSTGMMQMPQPDPRVARMQALQNNEWMPLDEVPDVPRCRTFILEQIMPEDVRFDWNVIRPEEIHLSADWLMHRTFMTREELGRKYQLTPEELTQPLAYDEAGNAVGQARRTPRAGRGTEDPANREDLEMTKVGDRCAVWECQYKQSGRVYVWASGMKRFLRNYVPTVKPKNFFTIFPLIFNRVTGRFLGLSDVFLQRSLQDEVNRLRTHELEARRSCYPKIVVGYGLLSKGEKQKLENALPYSVIEIRKANEISKAMHEIQPPTIHPELYDTTKAIHEMEIMAGIPQAAMGTMSGADSATESAITNQRMGQQMDFRKTIFEDFLLAISKAILDMSVVVIDPATALAIAGQGGWWPHLDRDKLYNRLELKIRAGSTGKPDAQRMNGVLTQLFQMIPQLSMCPAINLKAALKAWVQTTGVYIDIDALLNNMPMMPPGGMPGGAPGPGGTPPGGHAPPGAGAPPPGTPHPGAPPMSVTGPRPPEQIPGSPATALAHGNLPAPTHP